MMLELFKSNIDTLLSSKSDNRHLCAVSGGLDSMVMLDMALRTGQQVAVAHIDHNTRLGQSTKDADFVEAYCDKHSLTCHRTTIADGGLAGKNFQSEARDYRYSFFKELVAQYGYGSIWTAHHQTDRWETLLFNLSRAAGLDGLSSLRMLEGNLVRPLLLFSRADLEQYAREHDIPYVHDESNDSGNYVRNRIRHEITPVVQSVFPNIVAAASASARFLEAERALLDDLVGRVDAIERQGRELVVDMRKVRLVAQSSLLLYRLLHKYGYNHADCSDILAASTGAIFVTERYEALLDRDRLTIREVSPGYREHLILNDVGEFNLQDGRTLAVRASKDAKLSLKADFFDGGVIARTWESGDIFRPSGMNGQAQKVAKYLTSKKLSRWEKEKVIVLEHKGRIIQVVGHRSAVDSAPSEGKAGFLVEIVAES